MTRLPRLSCVELFIDGWRDVVVLSHGRAWLKGFEAATLAHVTLPAAAKWKPTNYSRTRLARRLRRNARTYSATPAIKRAIAELGRSATP